MKRGISIILLGVVSLVLVGCVAVAMVGAATSMVVYDRRSVVTIESDARIFYQIRKAIIPNPAFQNSHIIIESFNNVVLLVGETPNPSLRAMAEKIAQGTPQVRHVYDEIVIANPIPMTQRSKDSLITTEVRTKMLAKKGLGSGSIRIVTENAVVFLMGVVTHEQANLAVDVARQASGVNKVVKVFQYFN